ncbi:something about silencing, SAS, complex subunit 4-domain-containing protein [Morchella snyderi]|nr:something about silencing, SAS, complex subunit 4-domain-containing protein [Morchella snyderi]
MKRKVHIILRFSKQVNPPAATSTSASSEFSSSENSTPPATSFTSLTESPDSPQVGPMARLSSDNEGVEARSDKRKRKVQNKYKNSQEPDTASLPTPPSPSADAVAFVPQTSQLIGKRKRSVPKSIGGGKGDLQPPPKKARRFTASKQQPIYIRTTTATTTTNNPNENDKKEADKRVTRSQDTQQKSELAEWFEDREDEDDFVVDIDHPMRIVENDTTPRNAQSAITNGITTNGNTDINVNGIEATRSPGPVNIGIVDSLAGLQQSIPPTRQVVIETINLEEEARASSSRLTRFAVDPLSEDIYIRPHTSMGREEKRLRNVERDRAAHDKQRYEDRLERLRGPDWIKTFNLSTIAQKLGLVEMEKRKAGVVRWHESLLRKFKAWKEEERRKKLATAGRTSRSLTNSQERDLDESGDPDGRTFFENEDEGEEDKEDGKAEKDIYAITDDSDDDDHLHRSKQHRHTSKSSKSSHRLITAESPKKKQLIHKPFISFYNNPHMRQAVLNTSRKSSRNLKPFGVSLPELEIKDFELPEEFHQKTARHLRARRRVSK